MTFSELLEYARDNPKGYWFKRKIYGWGWIPVTWQGWLVLATHIVIVVGMILLLSPSPTFWEILALIVGIEIATFALIAICYKKGEKPRWQWGLKKR